MSRPAASLRQRLLTALLLVWALGALALTADMLHQSRQPDELMEDAGLATQARALVAGLRFDRAGRLAAVRPSHPWRRAYASPHGAYYTLYDPSGHAVARSPNLAQPLDPIPLAPGESLTAQRLVGPDQDLAAGVRAPHGYLLVVARSNPSRADQTPAQQWADYIPGVLFLGFAAAGLAVVGLVAAWSLRPLDRAAREAAQIGPDHPLARLSTAHLPAEIQPLALAVNQALDRVAAALASEKRFTAEAAHALRTPLAVLDLRLQRAEQGGKVDWPSVRADLAELGRVVSGLLTLSRADRAAALRAETDVNLTRLVREAAAAFTPRLEAEGRSIEVEAQDAPVILRGEAGELREMIFALIDNALTHGRGAVRLGLSADPGQARLTVADEGQGVSEDQCEAVFDRFHKIDGASPGAGLGLAIVRQTARSHGGDAVFVGPAMVEVRLALSAD